MAITLSEVSKSIDLDLPANLPADVKNDIKDEVGSFLVDSILDYVGEGRSPVTGRGFKQLDKEYADREKGGRTLANLDLEGDMLNSLIYRKTGDGVDVGIFDDSQTPKAFNHNTGDTLPKRQFIPDESENFVGDIKKGVEKIVKDRVSEFREDTFEPRVAAETRPTRSAPVVTTQSAVDDILDEIFNGD